MTKSMVVFLTGLILISGLVSRVAFSDQQLPKRASERAECVSNAKRAVAQYMVSHQFPKYDRVASSIADAAGMDVLAVNVWDADREEDTQFGFEVTVKLTQPSCDATHVKYVSGNPWF